MPELLNNAKSIFIAALDIADAQARERFIAEQAAGDAALQERVEELLRVAGQSGGLLDHSIRALLPTDIGPQIPEALGTSIGPYKLREILGEGGMGIVYAAEQEQPIRRRVALKVIKPGMDSKEIIGRFSAERQALALMDHPNIAKVLDAGTTESGRPYFVMELVRGLPITEYCDQARMPLRDRLKLFITVCQAIQHAHQKGIIHRDLKPSNVMITLHDSTPVPKVIDFGVAKALNQRLTEQTVYTKVNSLVGTPLYMSPEQAELSGLDVDTRTDVYSLGVLLYELLTGHTPFDKTQFSKIGYDEIRRIIREDEPLRPSQRVTTLGQAAATTVSERRGVETRQLKSALHRELDWIVMKALEKDRTRRYGSADAIAADLRCYLDDQPVQACPPSWDYRLRKLLRRQRGVLNMVAVLALCLPLAAYGVFAFFKGNDPQSIAQPIISPNVPPQPIIEQVIPEEAAPTTETYPASPIAAGRELPGLVPEPPQIPGIGRWQLITKQPRGLIKSAVYSPDETRIALGEATHVRIYEAQTLELLHVLVGHTQPVNSVAWHPDGQQLVSGGDDGTVRIWTAAGAPTHSLRGHAGPVYEVAWRPDGKCLASASADGTVRLWNADGTERRVIVEEGRYVFAVDWSPDGTLLATGSGDLHRMQEEGSGGDSGARVWNPETGELIGKFDDPKKRTARFLDWHPDGKQLAVVLGKLYRSVQSGEASGSYSENVEVRVWHLDGTPGPALTDQAFLTLGPVAWHPEGRRLVMGHDSGEMRVWNTDDNSRNFIKSGHAAPVTAFSWKRDGSRLLTTSLQSVCEWDGSQAAKLLVEGSISQYFFLLGAGWSPDGKTIAAQNWITPRFFSVDGAPAPLPERPAGNEPVWWQKSWVDPTRRPDGTPGPTLEGNTFPQNPPERDGYHRRIQTDPSMIKSDHPLPFLVQGREWAWNKNGWLAGAGRFGVAFPQIWNYGGKLVKTIGDHRGGMEESVAWSPDGNWLATAGGDTVRLWKSDGTPGPVLTGYIDDVLVVRWSPDGKWIATAGTDSAIRLWRRDGTAGPVLHGHPGGVYQGFAWSPDSRRIVACGPFDRTLRVWNIETGKTEWLALTTGNDPFVVLSSSGNPLLGDRKLLESRLIYLVERSDGSMELQSFAEFRRRYLPFLVVTYDMRRVVDLVLTGKLNEAVALFDDMAADDVNGDLRWDSVLNWQFLNSKFYKQAVITTSSSIRHGGPHPDHFKHRGAAYMGLKEYDKALADIAAAVELRPSDPGNFTTFRQELLWESPPEIQQAFFDLATKAIALSPANYVVRAGYYHHREEYENALADFAEAIKHSPNDGNLHNNVAWLLATCPEVEFRNPARAVELAERAVELSPKDQASWNTLGVARYRTGDWNGAIRDLRESMEIGSGGTSWDWYFLAMAHWQLGQKEDAVEWFEKAVNGMEKTPQNEELIRFRAEAAELLGLAENPDAPADAQPNGTATRL